MAELHLLTEDQTARIHDFETRILPGRMAEKKFPLRLEELNWAFGDRLTELLSRRPTRYVGTWNSPADDRVMWATRLILARTLSFAVHDRMKAGSAKATSNDLQSMRKQMLRTSGTIAAMKRSTRDYLREEGVQTFRNLKRINNSLLEAAEELNRLAECFPAQALKGVHPRARATCALNALIYLQATGVYPATSPAEKTKGASSHSGIQRAYVHIKPPPGAVSQWNHANAPPLLQLMKCAIDSVEGGRKLRTSAGSKPKPRSALLTTNSFEQCVDDLRAETLSK